MDTDVSLRESMGDIFATITEKGQFYLNKAIQLVDFPESFVKSN